MTEKKRTALLRFIGWGLMACLVLVLVLVAYINKHAENNARKMQMIAMKMKVEERKAELIEKKKEEKRLHEKGHIESEARKRIGMVKPGEVPIIVRQDKPFEVPNPESMTSADKSGGWTVIKAWLKDTKESLGRAISGSHKNDNNNKQGDR